VAVTYICCHHSITTPKPTVTRGRGEKKRDAPSYNVACPVNTNIATTTIIMRFMVIHHDHH